jgi:hypothetical protein
VDAVRGATRACTAIATALAAPACGDLVGFGGEVPPLATITVRATGEIAGDLRVAVVWGAQWLPEPLCILPPDSAEVEAVIAAGCRDPLAFTPARVAASAPLVANTDTPLALDDLPAADVMVGSLDARIAYASLVVFDDVDHSGTLELATPARLPQRMTGPDDDDEELVSRDVILGASFVSMTEPDRRLAFREGAYAPTGYYPRRGCGEPPPGFSVVSAGGFSLEAAITATAAGELPAQDPATCAEVALDATTVEIPVRDPRELLEVGCLRRLSDSSVRYAQPTDDPGLANRSYACAGIPTFPGEPAIDLVQLVVTGLPDDRCRGLTHYTLRGCDEGGLECDTPEWDFVATPPAWWPCPGALP